MNEEYVNHKVIKQYNLPIPHIPELYDYFLDLYEPLLKTRSIVNLAKKEIGDGNEEDYFKKIENTRQRMIDEISNTDAYKWFSDGKNPSFYSAIKADIDVPRYYEIPTQILQPTRASDIYRENNIGKYYISVDMKQANFQILKKFDSSMVFGADTYESLVEKFTDSEYYKGSKYLRQIMFGYLNPKRQNIMEKYYTGLILELIIREKILPKESVKVYTHDELVFGVDGYVCDDLLKQIEDSVKTTYGFIMHVDNYRINSVFNNAYVKENRDGSVSFKCVKQIYYAQIFKKYFGLDITKNDLAFVYEGDTAFLSKTLDGREL